MLRAVLDANVYISAIIHPAGSPGRLIERFLRDANFEIVLSPAIVNEVLRAMAYPKLRKLLRGADTQPWFEDIVVLADLVAGAQQLSGVCEDPDEDKYVAAALEGRAAYVVTGDRAFLSLEEHAGVARSLIYSVRERTRATSAHSPRCRFRSRNSRRASPAPVLVSRERAPLRALSRALLSESRSFRL